MSSTKASQPSARSTSESKQPTEPAEPLNASEGVAGTPGAPAPAPAPSEPAEQPSEPSDGSQEPDTGKPGAEAAKWRVKLRDEEAAHEATRQSLTDLRREVIDERLDRRGIRGSAKLLDAAGVDIESLWVNGVLDEALLETSLADILSDFSLDRKPLGYNTDQGTGPTDTGNSVTWSDVIKGTR